MIKNAKKTIIVSLMAIATTGALLAGCGQATTDGANEEIIEMTETKNSTQNDSENIYYTSQQVINPLEVTAENSKELRKAAMNEINSLPADTLEEQIRQRLYTWWGNWQPDYEGWLKCANDLYAEDATIYAIGGEQKFSDYKASMKGQRDACEMEMGPIMQMTVDGNTATLVYNMYLTPKGTDSTLSMMITEYNTFEEIDGKLMVTRLDLYTDGGAMGAMQ